MRFNVGDVVCLKSGGPAMTVTEVSGSQVRCIWFDGPNRSSGMFEMAVLNLVD